MAKMSFANQRRAKIDMLDSVRNDISMFGVHTSRIQHFGQDMLSQTYAHIFCKYIDLSKLYHIWDWYPTQLYMLECAEATGKID